jgi:hypothetical protein
MDSLEIRVDYPPFILPCLHRLPYGSFKEMIEDPILNCRLRKLGPFFFGSQLAMVPIVLV